MDGDRPQAQHAGTPSEEVDETETEANPQVAEIDGSDASDARQKEMQSQRLWRRQDGTARPQRGCWA